ncbi:quinone-dependent dihydroorotate dehydrogenase [Limoniibacter endophyticus]|nr:quinone-dependent dihydroorotate dehydrogenase [Limoniibacter endophyticus]
MNPFLQSLGRRALFSFDAETAHGMAIKALKLNLPVAPQARQDPRLATRLWDLDFPNPLGMAPGFDKNAEVPDAILGLGFGFVEVGTLTPKAQAGNPKPRLFRLQEDEAVINRMGFNNEGHDAACERLSGRRGNGIVGVNIGANKDSTDRIEDYVLGVRRFAPFASYLTVNISSPNTPGLRDMQARAALAELLSRVLEERERLALTRHVPILLKIAPDLADSDLEDVAAEAVTQRIDGLIISNTTLSRAGLHSANAKEAGGMSGKPLFQRATIALAKTRKLVGPDMKLIGVGGVDSAETLIDKIRAGADLVELYSSMVYAGPGLAGDILIGLKRFLDQRGLSSLQGLRDETADEWAMKSL